MITRRLAVRFAQFIALVLCLFGCTGNPAALAQAKPDEDTPTVTKVEPPSWWVNLTPDLLVMVTGSHLLANHVSCNIPEVIVSRTESTSGGKYLFVGSSSRQISGRGQPSAASLRFMARLALNCLLLLESKSSAAIRG